MLAARRALRHPLQVGHIIIFLKTASRAALVLTPEGESHFRVPERTYGVSSSSGRAYRPPIDWHTCAAASKAAAAAAPVRRTARRNPTQTTPSRERGKAGGEVSAVEKSSSGNLLTEKESGALAAFVGLPARGAADDDPIPNEEGRRARHGAAAVWSPCP